VKHGAGRACLSSLVARSACASILLALLSIGCAASLPDTPSFPPRNFLQRDFHLRSGLRVLVQEDHVSPLVVVTAVYGSGATADPASAPGLAHLVEHLVFRARTDGVKRVDRLKRTGATFNALTKADDTVYYEIAQPDVLSDLLDVEVDRLLHPLDGITEDDVAIERRVVLNERRQRTGSGGFSVMDQVRAQLFPPGHPLSRSLYGNEASLAGMTLALARGYASQHYRPENCTLVISGDVKWQQLEAYMQHWPRDVFAALDGGAAARPHLRLATAVATEPPPVRPTISTIKGSLPTTQVLVSWSLPGLSRDNEASLKMAAAALQVAELREVATSVLTTSSDGSILSVGAPLRRDESAEHLRDRLIEAATRARRVAGSERAADIIKVEAGRQLLYASADPVASALGLANHLATTGRASLYRDTSEALANVGLSDVTELVDKYLTPARAVVTVVEPDLEGTDEDEPAGPAAEQHHLDRDGDAKLTGMAGKDILRVARAPGTAALPRFRLPNGLDVVSIEQRNAPLALVELVIPGGNATAEPFGMATLAAGVSSATCSREHVALSEVAGTIKRAHSSVDTIVTVLAPEGNLANALAAAADDVTCRELGRSEFQVFTSAVEARARAGQKRSPQVQANLAFWDALYPNHPFGKLEGDAAALGRVDRETASRYVAEHFRPGGATAVVVSAHPPRLVRPMIDQYFAAWGPPAKPAAMPAPPPVPPARVVRTFEARRGAQSAIQLGCRLPPPTSETLPAYEVLDHVIDAQTNELRETWGATYGLHVAVRFYPGAAHLLISGAVESSHASAVISRLLGLIGSDASQGPDIKTWTLARWDVARGFNYRFATPSGLARALLFAFAHDFDADVWDRFPQRLADSSRSAVRDLLKDCAGHEVITIVGDATTNAVIANGIH
jgi:zinc protease